MLHAGQYGLKPEQLTAGSVLSRAYRLPMTQGSPLIRLYPGRLPPDTGQRRKRILRAGRRAFAGYHLAMVEGARLPSNIGRNFAKWASIAVDDSDDLNTVPSCKRCPVTQLMRDGAGTLVEAEAFCALGAQARAPHHAASSSRPAPARSVGRFRW
jgi:hypothetical protein